MIKISSEEANKGAEREISYRRDQKTKRLVIKIPAGIEDGTRIRLKGMGKTGNPPGDLYVQVNVK